MAFLGLPPTTRPRGVAAHELARDRLVAVVAPEPTQPRPPDGGQDRRCVGVIFGQAPRPPPPPRSGPVGPLSGAMAGAVGSRR
nr:hypothetical protein [Nocardia cyriacigeorgica]